MSSVEFDLDKDSTSDLAGSLGGAEIGSDSMPPDNTAASDPPPGIVPPVECHRLRGMGMEFSSAGGQSSNLSLRRGSSTLWDLDREVWDLLAEESFPPITGSLGRQGKPE